MIQKVYYSEYPGKLLLGQQILWSVYLFIYFLGKKLKLLCGKSGVHHFSICFGHSKYSLYVQDLRYLILDFLTACCISL